MKMKKIMINGKIIYTMKEEYKGQKTKDAHYKFVRLRGLKILDNSAKTA